MNATDSPRDCMLVDVALLSVRMIGGVIMAAHGAQKLFGLFGGQGMASVVDTLGPIAYPVAVGECFGGLGMMVGFLSRFSALANIVIMIGAIVMVHGKNGLLGSGGFEYNLALIGLFVPIVLLGPGRIAIGRFLPLPKNAQTGQPIVWLE